MKLTVNLAGASREELIELTGQLISIIEAQENPDCRVGRPTEAAGYWTEGAESTIVGQGQQAGPPPRRNAGSAPTVFARRREEPTHRAEHAMASCPECRTPLQGGRVRCRRQVITIPRVRARVTEHVVLERTCRNCRKKWTPEPDWSSLVVGRQRVGISVQSEVSVLREELRLPFGLIQRYLKWRYGLCLSVGELAALVRGAAECGQEEYDRLRQEIRASPVVYGDETGWREDGRNGYLWSFSNPKVRYFLRRSSRGSKVVEEVLGDEFEGVLVSDFYGAYNVHQGLHQRCWTHLLRDIHQLKEKYPQHQGLAEWAQEVREVYDHAQAYPGPDPQLPETVQQSQRVRQQQQYQQQLWSICKPYVGSDAPMSVLCQRVERFLPELFTFTADPRASADNNAAERSLRPTVVSRKISGGTRSEQGSETKSVLASLFGTWRLRGCNPYQALNSILSQPISAPV